MDPYTWIYIIMMVVSLAVSIANRPKIQQQPPPLLSDFQVPTAEEGREIKRIYGRVRVKDPNVLWYGNLRTRPIKASEGK